MLIRMAWRVVRTNLPNGPSKLHWYCPKCWEHRKSTQRSDP